MRSLAETRGGFFLMSGRGKPKHKKKEMILHGNCMISR
jgi:hypothetical protein